MKLASILTFCFFIIIPIIGMHISRFGQFLQNLSGGSEDLTSQNITKFLSNLKVKILAIILIILYILSFWGVSIWMVCSVFPGIKVHEIIMFSSLSLGLFGYAVVMIIPYIRNTNELSKKYPRPSPDASTKEEMDWRNKRFDEATRFEPSCELSCAATIIFVIWEIGTLFISMLTK
jgi:hypothetical protein